MSKKNQSLEFFRVDNNAVSAETVPFMSAPVIAGFPSPAEDFVEMEIDLNKLLIKNSAATFLARVRGSSMIDAGIFDGDLLIIDRSLEWHPNEVAICFIDNEFTAKRIQKCDDEWFLLPANESMERIKIKNELEVWGIVTYIIHKARN